MAERTIDNDAVYRPFAVDEGPNRLQNIGNEERHEEGQDPRVAQVEGTAVPSHHLRGLGVNRALDIFQNDTCHQSWSHSQEGDRARDD